MDGVTVKPADGDLELFAAWQAGNRRAGAALIERHYDAIMRFFRHKAGRSAEDLAQRTFLAFAHAAPTYRGHGTFKAWIFGIARNILLEHIRGRARDGRSDADETPQSLADLGPGVATMAAKKADQRRVAAALRQLPRDMQVLLELYYWEELGVDDLATVLGVPAGTIKSRLHAARARLKARLADPA